MIFAYDENENVGDQNNEEPAVEIYVNPEYDVDDEAILENFVCYERADFTSEVQEITEEDLFVDWAPEEIDCELLGLAVLQKHQPHCYAYYVFCDFLSIPLAECLAEMGVAVDESLLGMVCEDEMFMHFSKVAASCHVTLNCLLHWLLFLARRKYDY